MNNVKDALEIMSIDVVEQLNAIREQMLRYKTFRKLNNDKLQEIIKGEQDCINKERILMKFILDNELAEYKQIR